MAQTKSFDLVVIGGGPGGYVGAIRAAQLGMKVACVERDKLGGVCLNWGCIPTKALLAAAEFYHKLKHDADRWGIQADRVRHKWDKVISRSRDVAGQLNKGVHFLFKKNKIIHFEGHAFIPGAGSVAVYDKDDVAHTGQPQHFLRTKHTLIATGAEPRSLPGVDFDGEKIIDSKDAMILPKQPKKMLIVGAGAIGMEFAYFYNAFGTEIIVVEMMDRLLPVEDHDVSKAIAKAFNKQGIDANTATKTLNVATTKTGITAQIAPVNDSSKEQTISADIVLVAIGVKGRFDGLLDEGIGLELLKDHIKVDRSNYATNIAGIHAIGDVIGPPWLAHVASEEAIVCIERIAGHATADIDYDAIPGCTYCHPQVASIGFTEQRCRDEGLSYAVATFPFQASGKAQALGETEGFVKLITDKKHGEILGCHMIGGNVTELIAEIGLARRLEATADEIIATLHAHPTLSEAVHEAALGIAGRMVHF